MDHDPGYEAAAGGLIALFVLLYVSIFVVAFALAYVLQAIGYMQLFKRVGIEQHIAWIPVYNTWKFLEVGSQPGWIALLDLVPLGSYVRIVFVALAQHRVGISFGKDPAWVVLGIFLPWLWGIILGNGTDVYDPRRLQAFGYPPPYAGYGSVPRPAGAF